MYLHTTVRKNGKTHIYCRLVRSVRRRRRVWQETVAQLGELDPQDGRGPAPWPCGSRGGKSSTSCAVRLDQIRLERACRFGHVWLGWRLWRALALDRFCDDQEHAKRGLEIYPKAAFHKGRQLAYLLRLWNGPKRRPSRETFGHEAAERNRPDPFRWHRRHRDVGHRRGSDQPRPLGPGFGCERQRQCEASARAWSQGVCGARPGQPGQGGSRRRVDRHQARQSGACGRSGETNSGRPPRGDACGAHAPQALRRGRRHPW